MLRISVRVVACGAFLGEDVSPMSSGVNYQAHVSLVCPLNRQSSSHLCLGQESPPIVHQQIHKDALWILRLLNYQLLVLEVGPGGELK